MKKSIILVLSLLLMILPVTGTVSAGSDMHGSLKIHYSDRTGNENKAISGAVFSIYKLAGIPGDDSGYVLTDGFLPYSGTVTGLDSMNSLGSEELGTLAYSMKNIIKAQGIKSLASGVTDADGYLTFSSENGTEIGPGIYLVTGDKCVCGTYAYYASSSIIRIPEYDEGSHGWNYSIAVDPKYERITENSTDTTDITVTKIWKEQGISKYRPDAVTVKLYKNTQLYDTVALNKSNDWTYGWKDLEGGNEWFVCENEVSGYTFSVTSDGDVFAITNTPVNPEPESSEPDDDSQKEKLPQTGVLWWPVPVFAAAGLALTALGIVLSRRAGKDSR